ncbi:hypothetical protein HB779_06625 [Phyllobacterium sp. 628]|nr:hypothetical protein HB779_06625 [Phyllobacterium sp. 628]
MSAVNETPAVKHHSMTINGETVGYTASAGHLIAYAPKDPANPGKKDAQASIFYMAYTRDDLPRENRPVTFFWNGGPGSSSSTLHMGSWAPQRLKTGAPVMPESAKQEKPKSFPLIDNEETLLDRSDLVFVDPVGTGYSEAIKPHKNKDFWGMDADAAVIRDFITSYINRNKRQNSPKYLYGESYSGIRTPIVANLLEQAGITEYEQDASVQKPIVLSGIVLNSPILDFNSNCVQDTSASCAGSLPTFGLVADYYKKGATRGKASIAEYAEVLRKFVKEKHNAAHKIWYSPELAKAKGLYIGAKTQFDHLIDYPMLADSEKAKQWAIGNKENALSYGTSLADIFFSKASTEHSDFLSKFLIDPYMTLKDYTDATAGAAKKI